MSIFILYATLAILSIIYITIKKNTNYLYITCLFYLATFDVTTILKIGLTINFFEIAIIILLLRALLTNPNITKLDQKEKNVIYFLMLGIIVFVIAQFRIFFEDLETTYQFDDLLFRTVKSNSKLIFYSFSLYFISRVFPVSQKNFIIGVALGGIPMAIASLIQALGLGMILIHNNPSFGEILRIESYDGGRPVGLSNESSFYVFQLTFSFSMLLLAFFKKYLSNKKVLLISILYGISFLVSISRTGWVLLPLILGIIYFYERKTNKKSYNHLGVIIFIIFGIILISNLDIQGFNVLNRFTSTFDSAADDSTIERFGSARVLFELFLDKSLFVGVGLYNYMFYVSQYYDSYMSFIYAGSFMPSFSLVLQFLAEFGTLFFGILLLRLFIYYKTALSIEKYWFVIVLLFAVSFQVTNFACTYFIFLYSTYSQLD